MAPQKIGSPSIYIHVGLPKVASTTLQEDVFPNLKGVRYLGSRESINLESLLRSEKVLISDENLSGGLLEGQIFDDFRRRMQVLSRIFPTAHLILGLRRHEDWLASLYKHYLYMGLGDNYFNEIFSCSGDSIIELRDLTYLNYLEAIKNSFGEYPLIITLDDIKNQISGLLRILCSYLEIPYSEQTTINPSQRGKGLSQEGVRVVRSLNQYKDLLPTQCMQYLRWGIRRVNGLFPKTREFQIDDRHVECIRNRLDSDWDEVQRIARSQRQRLLSTSASKS